MLTAGHHPCQALADLMTLREAFGRLKGLKIAYVGDGNNVARSLALVGAIVGVEVAVASPEGYTLTGAPGALLTTDPAEAVAGAHAIYADVWVSMGDEETADERRAALAPYRLDDALLDLAAPGAIALHCLPAHPGEEITAELLYGRASASGSRPRTAATRRRRCWSCCCGEGRRARCGTARRYGRMTVEDVVQLGSVFAQVARRQAGDTLVALRGRVARSSKHGGRG